MMIERSSRIWADRACRASMGKAAVPRRLTPIENADQAPPGLFEGRSPTYVPPGTGGER